MKHIICHRTSFRAVKQSLVNKWFYFAVLVGISASIATACDHCMHPQVALYDCKVVPPRPTSDSAILIWRNLFWVAAGVKDYVMNTDPTKDCMTILDGAFFTKGDTATNSIKSGAEYANLPPAQGRAGGYYYLTGTVDGSGTSYTATIQLVASKSREVLKTGTATFVGDVFSGNGNAIVAGKAAAAQIGPIMDAIRDFEKKKRASGEPYALRPTAELHPAKSVINKGEAVDVEIWLYDCDGDISSSPLPNRTIKLSAEGGTFKPATVTTGSDGKATSTFTAGNKAIQAEIQAVHIFTYACGDSTANEGGFGSIMITPVKPTLWRVSGTIHNRNLYDEVKNPQLPNIIDYSSQHSNNDELFTVNAVLRNVSQDSLDLFKSDTAMVAGRVNGMHSEFEQTRSLSQVAGVVSTRWVVDVVHANPSKSTDPSNKPTIDFNYFLIHSNNRNSSSRTFELSGWDVKGPWIEQGQECSALDGCKSLSGSDQSSGTVEAEIYDLSTDAGFTKDTTYSSGNHTTTVHNKETITISSPGDTVYQLYSHFTQTDDENAAPADLIHKEILHELNLTISPLSPSSNAVRHGVISSGDKTFLASLYLKNNTIGASAVIPASGTLTIQLFDIQGRMITEFIKENCAKGEQHFPVMLHNSLYGGPLVARFELRTPEGTAKAVRQFMVLSK